MENLRCMTFISKSSSEVLIAGLQDTMLLVDLQKGEISKRVLYHLFSPSFSPIFFLSFRLTYMLLSFLF